MMAPPGESLGAGLDDIVEGTMVIVGVGLRVVFIDIGSNLQVISSSRGLNQETKKY